MLLNKVSPLDIQKQIKANELEGYQKSIEHDAQNNTGIKSFERSGIRWNIIKDKENNLKVNPLLETDHVSISTIRKFDKTVSSTIIAHKLGYKIGLSEKKDILIDKYIKNFLQAKSHNYIVAKFAQLKSAFLMQLLSNIGVTVPELQKLQKKAIKDAREENELLFEENEYNSEMLCVIGGSGKRLKRELQIMDEIRTQLTTQMNKLDAPDYYSEERMINIRIKACKKIRDEFQKEKDFLDYERNYHFINRDQVKTRDKKNVFDN